MNLLDLQIIGPVRFARLSFLFPDTIKFHFEHFCKLITYGPILRVYDPNERCDNMRDHGRRQCKYPLEICICQYASSFVASFGSAPLGLDWFTSLFAHLSTFESIYVLVKSASNASTPIALYVVDRCLL